jgi:hypothetical protein
LKRGETRKLTAMDFAAVIALWLCIELHNTCDLMLFGKWLTPSPQLCRLRRCIRSKFRQLRRPCLLTPSTFISPRSCPSWLEVFPVNLHRPSTGQTSRTSISRPPFGSLTTQTCVQRLFSLQRDGRVPVSVVIAYLFGHGDAEGENIGVSDGSDHNPIWNGNGVICGKWPEIPNCWRAITRPACPGHGRGKRPAI